MCSYCESFTTNKGHEVSCDRTFISTAVLSRVVYLIDFVCFVQELDVHFVLSCADRVVLFVIFETDLVVCGEKIECFHIHEGSSLHVKHVRNHVFVVMTFTYRHAHELITL